VSSILVHCWFDFNLQHSGKRPVNWRFIMGFTAALEAGPAASSVAS